MIGIVTPPPGPDRFQPLSMSPDLLRGPDTTADVNDAAHAGVTGERTRTGNWLTRLLMAFARRPIGGASLSIRRDETAAPSLSRIRPVRRVVPAATSLVSADVLPTAVVSDAVTRPLARVISRPSVAIAPVTGLAAEAERLQKEHPDEVVAAVVRAGSDAPLVRYAPPAAPVVFQSGPAGTQPGYGTIGEPFSAIYVGATSTFNGVSLRRYSNEEGNGRLLFSTTATALPGPYRFSVDGRTFVFHVLAETPETARVIGPWPSHVAAGLEQTVRIMPANGHVTLPGGARLVSGAPTATPWLGGTAQLRADGTLVLRGVTASATAHVFRVGSTEHRLTVTAGPAEHAEHHETLANLLQIIHALASARAGNAALWTNGATPVETERLQRNRNALNDVARWAYELSAWMRIGRNAITGSQDYFAALRTRKPRLQQVLDAAVPLVGQTQEDPPFTLTAPALEGGRLALAGLTVPDATVADAPAPIGYATSSVLRRRAQEDQGVQPVTMDRITLAPITRVQPSAPSVEALRVFSALPGVIQRGGELRLDLPAGATLRAQNPAGELVPLGSDTLRGRDATVMPFTTWVSITAGLGTGAETPPVLEITLPGAPNGGKKEIRLGPPLAPPSAELVATFGGALPIGAPRDVDLPSPAPDLVVRDHVGSWARVPASPSTVRTDDLWLSIVNGKLRMDPAPATTNPPSGERRLRFWNGIAAPLEVTYTFQGANRENLRTAAEYMRTKRAGLRDIYGHGALRANDQIPLRPPRSREDVYHDITQEAVTIDNRIVDLHRSLLQGFETRVYTEAQIKQCADLTERAQAFISQSGLRLAS